MDSVPGLGAKWIALPTHKADEKPMNGRTLTVQQLLSIYHMHMMPKSAPIGIYKLHF